MREIGVVAREVKFRNRPRVSRAADRVLRWVDSPARLRRPALPAWRRVVLHGSAVLALRALAGGGLRRVFDGSMSAIASRVRDHAAHAEPITRYVTAPDETTLVRRALLLRQLSRHGTAVDLLLARYRSGRPATATCFWLSFLLREIGEEKMAALLDAATPEATAPARNAPPRTSVRGAIVVLAMFDSDVFRASLRSLASSDFNGEIMVVEDGDHDGARCEAFCRELGVRYHRAGGWLGNAAALNAGIDRLGAEPQVVFFAHSDVLWPADWWTRVADAWAGVLPAGKVGLLNLTYLQIGPAPERSLAALFRRGEYEELAWLLHQMRGLDGLAGQVEHALLEDRGRLFGLSRDVWNDAPAHLKAMAGRFSVASSFPYALWRAIGGFDPALPYGCDLQLQYECLQRRQWMLWVDNRPLVHFVSSDTKSLDRARREQFVDKVGETYKAFKARYGVTIDHFLTSYFGETAVVHHDAIVEAANAGRFEDVDGIFDEFWSTFQGKRLSTCELVDCRSRGKCIYV